MRTPITDRRQPIFVGASSPTAGRSVTGLNPCRGLYWGSSEGTESVAFLITHYDEDLSEHYLIPWLTDRGYGVLGWNTRYQGQPQYFSLAHALVDIGVAIRWLRETAGIAVVILLGNSGGGSLSIVYQGEATDPDGVMSSIRRTTEDIPAADGLITLNAHVGRPEWLTSTLDPSVTDEEDPLSRREDLDLFAPTRTLPLDSTFVSEYRSAQRDRNLRIGSWVDVQRERMMDAGARDRLFVLHRVWADPRFVDLSIDPSDRDCGCFLGDPRNANMGVYGPARICTIRSWMEMWDLRESRCTSTRSAVRVRVPSLVIQSLADQGVFPSDPHAIFDRLGSDDRSLNFVTGDHFLRDDSSKEETVEAITAWVGQRW